MPRLKGNSPVRGNVCKADKRVPVSGGKGGFAVGKDGEALLFNLYVVYKNSSPSAQAAGASSPKRLQWRMKRGEDGVAVKIDRRPKP